ncbi:MAG TPA: sulfurtransferase [Microbacteriaceae bacterium]|nr:sulfurtransferase [Microbacteriaceae bacterium]
MSANRIAAGDLAARLGEPGLRIIDATVFLSFPEGQPLIEPGTAAFATEHIPGAVFADLTAPGFTEHGGEAPFAAAASEDFAAAVAELGVNDADTVVVYDSVNGIWATRLWWQFQLEGHDDVRVLDGGLAAWKSAGLPVAPGEGPTPAAGSFTARRRPERVVSTQQVLEATDDDSVLLIEALDAKLYERGHIPGAVNVPAASLYREDGTLRPVGELREIFQAVGALEPGVRPVAYCGGGIAATAVTFALQELGRSDVAVYDGSKNAWTADPARPLVAS